MPISSIQGFTVPRIMKSVVVPGLHMTGQQNTPVSGPVADEFPDTLGADLLAWYDTYDPAYYTLNGGDYSKLTNRRNPSTGDMVQNTAANQPFQNVADWNGQATARFTGGNDDVMRTGADNALYDNRDSIGVFLVGGIWGASHSTDYMFSWYSGGANNLEMFVLNATTLRVVTEGGSVIVTTDVTIAVDAEFALFAQIRADGSRNVWLNGVEQVDVASTALSVSYAHQNTAIGGRFQHTANAYAYSEFGHVGITAELDDTQISDYFAWATEKFGV